jgi:hypothetical protein
MIFNKNFFKNTQLLGMGFFNKTKTQITIITPFNSPIHQSTRFTPYQPVLYPQRSQVTPELLKRYPHAIDMSALGQSLEIASATAKKFSVY